MIESSLQKPCCITCTVILSLLYNLYSYTTMTKGQHSVVLQYVLNVLYLYSKYQVLLTSDLKSWPMPYGQTAFAISSGHNPASTVSTHDVLNLAKQRLGPKYCLISTRT